MKERTFVHDWNVRNFNRERGVKNGYVIVGRSLKVVLLELVINSAAADS